MNGGNTLSHKKSLIYAIVLSSFFAIFCVYHHLSDTVTVYLSPADDSVDHGCYWLHSASDQTPMSQQQLVERKCNKTYPDVIIAGVKKCGTTALRNFLKFHPQLASIQQETHFFDSKYHMGMEWYLEQMPYTTPEQLTMVKTPKYFVHPLSPSAIQKHLGGNTKFIFIVRDPVQRAISDFAHVYVSNAQSTSSGSHSSGGGGSGSSRDTLETPLTTQQEAIRNMVKRLEKHNTLPSAIKDTFEESVLFPNGSVNTATSLIDTGIYIKHLRRWLALFPREQMLVLDGEEYIYNPLPTLQQVERFLDLQPYFKEENFYFDVKKSFFCMAHPVRSCLRDGKGRTHPYVSYDAKQTLYDFYEPYNLELAYVLQHNFSWVI